MINAHLIKALNAADGPFTLNVKFSTPSNQIVAIYGPSGAGKTTLLRMIAGLTRPEGGLFYLDDQCWYNQQDQIWLAPQDRKVGFVFQDYALFPNMSVLENIRFAVPESGYFKAAEKLVHHFDLDELRDVRPDKLSGGQQQRVAVARALAQQPNVLCLDEPLSALDYSLRLQLQDYIINEHRNRPFSIFIVSHDLAEIFKMANQVLHLKDGEVINFGAPEVVFSNSTISGKFQFTGKIITIQKAGIIHIVTVLVDNQMVKVVVDEQDVLKFKEGDQVLVATKAFNPIIYKI